MPKLHTDKVKFVSTSSVEARDINAVSDEDEGSGTEGSENDSEHDGNETDSSVQESEVDKDSESGVTPGPKRGHVKKQRGRLTNASNHTSSTDMRCV
ncbi:hypothetical protein PAXRUDRAFT_823369 [Paxillus rubicundulus Ve08.2h10]|uniref:Uncharacterized protein n=1 Tax=Paxillus rubicundulus Ve08.2h10 TaxID=930991 RepID=A0A0D0DVJ0_9AGAM|nr:hypothetical protein PAXRUDRAFT_823369 [Paxillus rubicundulus Ve08.2h10]